MKAMAARETHISRVYVDALNRGALVPGPHTRSWVCALDRIDRDSLFLFHLLQHFDGKDLKHKKTLKQAKILENNKAKGLTNIN